MPRSAIATRLVDLVFPAGEIARRLARFARQPAPIREDPDQLSEEDAEEIYRIWTPCTGS